jgi:DNA-binding MarR family transcriptional regulator
MPDALSYDLHKLTARLDRAADSLLRKESGLTYSRFLALFAVMEGANSQRALAEWLGQSEPSTSRMVTVLSGEGLLQVERPPGGNRRLLRLTPRATAVVERCAALLEGAFESVIRDAGIDEAEYKRATRRLLAELADRPDRVAASTAL